MKNFLKILFLYLLLQMVACKSTSKLGSTNTSTFKIDSISEKEYITKIDTFYQQLSDSAKAIVYINCDSLNNPKINTSSISQGKNLKMKFKFEENNLKSKEKNKNIPLIIDCNIDSNKVAFSYFNIHKEKFISKLLSDSTIIKEPVLIEKRLTKKQTFFMQLGKYTFWFFIIILCILTGIGIAKLVKYLKWL